MNTATDKPWKSVKASKSDTDGMLDIAIVDSDNNIIAECFGRVGESDYRDAGANAELIVRAVNNNDALVDALKDVKDYFVTFEGIDPIKIACLMNKITSALNNTKVK